MIDMSFNSTNIQPSQLKLIVPGRAIIWNCIPSVRYTGAIFFHSIIIHRNNAISMYPLIVFDVKNTEIVLNGLIISHILIYITKNNKIIM